MKKALLVDDDALFRRTLARSLERRGFEVVVAGSIDEAVAIAAQESPDFALVDLRLGEASGLDLVRPLRDAHPSMRIVLVTGYASVATAVEAIKRGADHYLAKPVTIDAILRALDLAPAPGGEPEATMTPMSRLEWEHIQQALVDSAGSISGAARLLGMHRRSLQRKLAKKPGRERTPPHELD